MTGVRIGTLLGATLATGLMAGIYFAFACSVMPGLRATDARTLVGTMQSINVAIVNGWFLLVFVGAPLLTLVAGAAHLPVAGRGALPWIAAGLALNVVAFVVTGAANIPLNNALDAAGPIDQIADLEAVRDRFEDAWIRWNLVRTAATTAAFACLGYALVLTHRPR
ncbi:DUF1772 domain-containing protein [Frankia sp. CNm7]|uniref:DUF1772 domain-containing protein n=1 Tax=Frankia nepalensis TaxID=1836974 RepID=A0A937RIJ7_9ACTN|nr:anthrone oxygenase family protein [Frankia nepalensis]MBL7498894.1 DUF1772 domain-containing protein [Frankia nepalensis]MBL7512569.1 DUF1772 domain-containing protein [Frankia nepalensis]MBL7524256.1 DUF1772 domain-containing protein [Frankia nepalensis]MBL7632916.1 DUF1772 domain-containing protein [Frankia nepalensis]